MSQEQIAICDMQSWVFRHAQKNWNITARECADLFQKYDLLTFISECYDLLHLRGYQRALEDIEDILHAKRVTV